nr:MAG TPA: Toxin Ibs, type I toxin-antitoxin system [Caudoviricetes sp.]
MKKYLFITLLLTLISLPAYSQPKNHFFYEKDYQNYWCSANNGKTEVILNDKARVDCLTLNYAVEVDFAPKWAESIGQSLYYASVTKKAPGVLLILENPTKDLIYLKRLQTVAKQHNITVWTVTPSEVYKWKYR